jgi:hypothetical protein
MRRRAGRGVRSANISHNKIQRESNPIFDFDKENGEKQKAKLHANQRTAIVQSSAAATWLFEGGSTPEGRREVGRGGGVGTPGNRGEQVTTAEERAVIATDSQDLFEDEVVLAEVEYDGGRTLLQQRLDNVRPEEAW